MEDTDLGRVVAVLAAPTRTFRAIVERPGWWAPFVVLTLLAVIGFSIQGPKIDWQETIDTKLERSDREVDDPRALELILGFLEEHGTLLLVASAFVMPWIFYPLLALVLRGILRRMGGELSFRTSLAVLLHGFMPWAVAYLLAIPILLRAESINLYDPGRMVPSLVALANPDTGLELWLLLSSIDLFSIWTMVLLVIGYGVAAKISRLRAAAAVVGLWALWVGFYVGMAALD